MTADMIGWIGNIFFVYGVYVLGKKKISGFYANAIGNLAYVIVGIMKSTSSLACLSVLLIILNIMGILEWRKGK